MSDKELTYGEVWKTLKAVDVSKHTEEKMNLTYLSWSRAWTLLMDNYPQAQYEFVNFTNSTDITSGSLPYRTLPDGTTEVVTRITIDSLSREMRLPVMDYKNNPVVNPHARQVSDNSMRCLVKNMAMFGLGISVFTCMSDDTLPDEAKDKQPKGKKVPAKSAPVKKETPEEKTELTFDKEWAGNFVDGCIKLIDGSMYKTREEIVGFYKENSNHIGVLKDQFPEHKKLLDDHIKEFINNITEK
tara:strand:+ start:159 stop:887 length:729 start_codon:yes stop_codon:yes gene_type:complete